MSSTISIRFNIYEANFIANVQQVCILTDPLAATYPEIKDIIESSLWETFSIIVQKKRNKNSFANLFLVKKNKPPLDESINEEEGKELDLNLEVYGKARFGLQSFDLHYEKKELRYTLALDKRIESLINLIRQELSEVGVSDVSIQEVIRQTFHFIIRSNSRMLDFLLEIILRNIYKIPILPSYLSSVETVEAADFFRNFDEIDYRHFEKTIAGIKNDLKTLRTIWKELFPPKSYKKGRYIKLTDVDELQLFGKYKTFWGGDLFTILVLISVVSDYVYSMTKTFETQPIAPWILFDSQYAEQTRIQEILLKAMEISLKHWVKFPDLVKEIENFH